MSPIFTFIVIVLGLLAIANIIVGVANDAINFMNAAWGSRVARYRTILIVASVGSPQRRVLSREFYLFRSHDALFGHDVGQRHSIQYLQHIGASHFHDRINGIRSLGRSSRRGRI